MYKVSAEARPFVKCFNGRIGEKDFINDGEMSHDYTISDHVRAYRPKYIATVDIELFEVLIKMFKKKYPDEQYLRLFYQKHPWRVRPTPALLIQPERAERFTFMALASCDPSHDIEEWFEFEDDQL